MIVIWWLWVSLVLGELLAGLEQVVPWRRFWFRLMRVPAGSSRTATRPPRVSSERRVYRSDLSPPLAVADRWVSLRLKCRRPYSSRSLLS